MRPSGDIFKLDVEPEFETLDQGGLLEILRAHLAEAPELHLVNRLLIVKGSVADQAETARILGILRKWR